MKTGQEYVEEDRSVRRVFLFGSRDIVGLRFVFTSYALPEVVRCRWDFRGSDLPCSTANRPSITGSADSCDALHCGFAWRKSS
jgi:hypothetical protein